LNSYSRLIIEDTRNTDVFSFEYWIADVVSNSNREGVFLSSFIFSNVVEPTYSSNPIFSHKTQKIGFEMLSLWSITQTKGIQWREKILIQPDSRSGSDAASWKLPVREKRGWVRSARYITMQDGVKNAIYLYLPGNLKENERIPTIIIPTPYFSMAKFRSPFFERIAAKLAVAGQGEWAEDFARFGYATVLWDLRGSGASYGRKLSIMKPDAVRDANEVINWIVQQPWSNGRVGATGVSARAMIIEWMLLTKHPALKAVVPRFTVFDIFTATTAGGLKASRFIQDVGEMLRAMDANRLHQMSPNPVAKGLLRFLGMQIMPMDEDEEGRMLAEAIQDHAENEYFDRDLMAVTYRDDKLPGSSIPATIDTQSPFSFAKEMEESGIPIYGYTGWYDGGFPREMLNLYMTVRTPGSKLIIGPWGHHARFNSSPVVVGKQPSSFDQAAEIVRFFDYYLKDVDFGISNDAPIHYFTMGEEKWKGTDVWPPKGVQSITYYLSSENKLSHEPSSEEAFDNYTVDFTTGTGDKSRFGQHLAGGRFPVRYPDRNKRDLKLLTYTSTPLEQDLECTGTPIVTLFASSNMSDGGFFAYLEDVGPDGNVVTVTDGCLRGCFHQVSNAQLPYWQEGPYRTYMKSETKPLVPGEITELKFDLFPTSFLFRAGHSIRLALSGADKDNFAIIPPDGPPALRFYRGDSNASCIDLPVIGLRGAED
jgi:putative CocE/NonD family hydrolase